MTLMAHPGPDERTERAAWLEARRHGISATEVRDLAKGYGSDRRRIMAEKLDGTRDDTIQFKPHVAHGKSREEAIAQWIEDRFGITAVGHLYVNDEDPRKIASPDGVEVSPFDGSVVCSEVKTSKHDLTPPMIALVDGYYVPRKLKGRTVHYEGHFADTGYYDQMQWQMDVLGADECLFAYEQHDDDWSGWPERAPKPIHREPLFFWVKRDDDRIKELRLTAWSFLDELEREREARAIRDAGGLTAEQLQDAGVEEDDEEAIVAEAQRLAAAAEAQRARIVELGEQIVDAREARDEAERVRAAKQAELDELLAGGKDLVVEEEDDVRVSVTTSQPKPKMVFDKEAAQKRAPSLFQRYDAIVKRYTKPVPQEPKTTITVTSKRPKPAAE
jgi:hypothetical protein